jgi:hypothetical protein
MIRARTRRARSGRCSWEEDVRNIFDRPVSPFVRRAMDVVIGENVDWKSNPGNDLEWQRKAAKVDRLPTNNKIEKGTARLPAA